MGKTFFSNPIKYSDLEGVDLALIMHKLNHSNLSITKRYLGITSDELKAVIQKLNLRKLLFSQVLYLLVSAILIS